MLAFLNQQVYKAVLWLLISDSTVLPSLLDSDVFKVNFEEVSVCFTL